MPAYCDKIKDPAKRKACNKAGYANQKAKAPKTDEMSRVRSTKKKGY